MASYKVCYLDENGFIEKTSDFLDSEQEAWKLKAGYEINTGLTADIYISNDQNTWKLISNQ